jgi:hypothetical protein
MDADVRGKLKHNRSDLAASTVRMGGRDKPGHDVL